MRLILSATATALATLPSAVSAQSPPAADAVLERLQALESKVAALEARNAELEAQAAAATDRIKIVETNTAKAVQAGAAPTFSDPAGQFTFHPRGTLELDYAAYDERAGGYRYNDGTDIRRARFGFDGTFLKQFKYRIEAEYVKNSVNLLDAYIQYAPGAAWLLTVGQHKAPYGLEPNTSDSYNTFLERGMANVAFGAVGAERRVGVSLGYASRNLTATVGLFGGGEAIQRDAGTPGETRGINGRVTWEPIAAPGRLLHVGASGFRVSHFAGNAIANLGDRPNSRVDGGRLIALSIPGGPQAGARAATYYGAEGAAVYGAFSVQGEYNRLSIDRFGADPTIDVDGFYVFGSVFLTGESRAFRNGTVDRLKPRANFDPARGTWGAVELAVRYDQLDLTDFGFSPLRRKAHTLTGAANWYLNPNLKLMINYIRFTGENSPLAFTGATAKGDIVATRLHLDF
ncbi:MAG TPA: porin [Sphingomonadaceae bacterium]|nr:porin [Sphingomonadaceae bacterium]